MSGIQGKKLTFCEHDVLIQKGNISVVLDLKLTGRNRCEKGNLFQQIRMLTSLSSHAKLHKLYMIRPNMKASEEELNFAVGCGIELLDEDRCAVLGWKVCEDLDVKPSEAVIQTTRCLTQFVHRDGVKNLFGRSSTNITDEPIG